MFQRSQCLTKIHILFLLLRWYNHNAVTLSHRKDSGPGQMGYWRVLTGLNLIVWLVVLCLAPESRTLCWQLVCAHRHACISFTVQALIALTLILICWDSVIARLRGYPDELVSPVFWCLTQNLVTRPHSFIVKCVLRGQVTESTPCLLCVWLVKDVLWKISPLFLWWLSVIKLQLGICICSFYC